VSKPILQLRVELLHIKPLIWRRLQVPGNSTFWDLHVAIQSAFAWADMHLHEFRSCGPRDGSLNRPGFRGACLVQVRSLRWLPHRRVAGG